jgi:hypothetical protein
VGGIAFMRGVSWPSLSARYERSVRSPTTDERSVRTRTPESDKVKESGHELDGGASADVRTGSSDQLDGSVETTGEVANQALWNAIERGEDPTKY